MSDLHFSGRPAKRITAQLYAGNAPVGAAIAMTEIETEVDGVSVGTGEYLGNLPTGTPAGQYLVVFYSDTRKLASGVLHWDGAREVSAASLRTDLVSADLAVDIASRVVNSQVEPGASVLGSLKLLNAFVAGNVRGAGSNVEKFSNLAGTHDVIVSTNDANGNRRCVHLNLQD